MEITLIGQFKWKVNLYVSKVYLYCCKFLWIQILFWTSVCTTFQAVTLLVLCPPPCSHCEGHLLSPSGASKSSPLISNKTFSSFLFYKDLSFLCKIMHSTNAYINIIDCWSFSSRWKPWKGKNKARSLSMQREVKQKNRLWFKRKNVQWLRFSRFEKINSTIAQDVSWQMMHALPLWPKTKEGLRRERVTGHMHIYSPRKWRNKEFYCT